MKRIFEFRCVKDHITERLVDDEVRSVSCPHCSNEASRIISSPRIRLEGITGAFPSAYDAWLENTSKQQGPIKRKARANPMGILNFLESVVDRRIMWQN